MRQARVARQLGGDHHPQRLLDARAAWDVDEDAVRPEGAMQRGELAVARGYRLRHEVPLEQIAMLANRRGQVGEDDALRARLVAELILHLAPVMQPQKAGERLVALGGRHERLRWCALSAPSRLVLVELEPPQVGAPPLLILARRHRNALVRSPGVEPPLAHPFRLTPPGDKLIEGVEAESAPRHWRCHSSAGPFSISPLDLSNLPKS